MSSIFLTTFEGVGWDTVVFHEDETADPEGFVEIGFQGREILLASVVEATNNSLLANLANFGSLAVVKTVFVLDIGEPFLPECSLPC